MTVTLQRVELDTKEGKRFLRRVIRENEELRCNEMWSVDACPAQGWKLRFYRTVKGDIGDPDREVEVMTDETVGIPRESECGEVKAFEDSQPVIIPHPTRLWLNMSPVSTLAEHLAKGGKVRIEASAGSTTSSCSGLAFLTLDLTSRCKTGRTSCVTLSQTVFINGRTVCSGAVCVS